VAQNAHKCNLPVEIFDCKGRFDIKTILSIRYFLRENKIDIIHSHGYKSNFYGLLAALNMNIKRITTCHNWLGTSRKMRFYKWLDKTLLNKFDNVVVVSDVLKKEVLKSEICEEKVKVIYNGTDTENFKFQILNSQKQGTNSEGQRANSLNSQKQGTEAQGNKGKIETDGGEQIANGKWRKAKGNKIREDFGIKDDEKVVETVGRLTEEKGHIYFLKAAKEVEKEYSKGKFLIVGDGSLMKTLKLEVGNLKLEDRVIFTGTRSDIPDMLNLMDVFVLPSLKEGIPMALLEAMAAKKPVIASKVGGVPKVIEDSYTGLLMESGDVKKLADSIVELLKDKKKANFLAQNGYEKIKNEFSSKKMAEKYIKIYSE
ncbi:glycosyltransferase family 4 protein, partial [bacterium]|nr:glycosyltransferase family 4 protein [bacterium]